MAEAKIIEDLDNLRGEDVFDQDGRPLGSIQDVYALGEDSAPMWVTVEPSEGFAGKRLVFVPLARLKLQDDRLQVPYSVAHLREAPEVEADGELTEEQDRELRDFYAIDLADAEQRTDNVSYAAQVPDGDGQPKRLDSQS
jgi:hypothetical protein